MAKINQPSLEGYEGGKPTICDLAGCNNNPTTVYAVNALVNIDEMHQVVPAALAVCMDHQPGQARPHPLDSVHVFEQRDEDPFNDNAPWTLMHPPTCRPNLFDCPVNRAAENMGEPLPTGKYVVKLNDEEELTMVRKLEEGEL